MTIPTARVYGINRCLLEDRGSQHATPAWSPEAIAAIERVQRQLAPNPNASRIAMTNIARRQPPAPRPVMPVAEPEPRHCAEPGCDEVMRHGSQVRCETHARLQHARNKAAWKSARLAAKKAERSAVTG
jgi:hypothetical protein